MAASIAIDDARNTSRIVLALDPGDDEIVVSDVPGYPLSGFRGTFSGSMDASTELGLVLSSHDHPLARIVSALKIIFVNINSFGDRTYAINFGRVQMVVEWMRWLNPDLSYDDYRELGSLIMARLSAESRDSIDDVAIEVGLAIWRAIEP